MSLFALQLLLLLAFVVLRDTNGFMGQWISRSAIRSVLNMVETKNINMPALSSTMKEGKIVSWTKKVGDKVSSGDVLLVVESDKADMDVESFEDGYLAAIYTPEGASAEVGATVAVLVDSMSDVGKVGPAPVAGGAAASKAPAAPATPAAPVSAAVAIDVDFEKINMPALSSTMKEGKIVSWSKKVGDKVSSGDVLLVVESDKADMDVESYEDGFLASVLVPEGGSAPVGAPVALLAKSAADISKVQAAAGALKEGEGAAAKAASVAPAAPAAPAAPEAASSYTPAAGTVNATPKARKLAADNGLDVAKIKGTGNFGRITPDDVLKAAGKWVAPVVAASATATAAPVGSKSPANAPAAVAVLDGIKAMDGMQKAVAKNMEKTLDVPVFRVSREIVTDEFDALYAQLKPKGVTVSSMLAKACAEVLKKHPIVNAAYVDGGIKYSKDINVAMAVAIDGGLITPTIIKAQDQDLFQMSRVWKDLVEKAKTKRLSPVEYSSGTFTISNLGMFGVAQFDAILPPGTGAILAIAASTPKVVQTEGGKLAVQKSMTVTITADHRHMYGAHVAEFLKDLGDLIENRPKDLLMG